jgi:hypothetical protein
VFTAPGGLLPSNSGYLPATVYTGAESANWLRFDPSAVVPTSHENRPASVSVSVCISY